MDWITNKIFNFQFSIFKIVLILFFVFLVSGDANAARVYFELPSTTYKVGDRFILPVLIDTEGESLNALDIKISIPELLEVQEISKNGSVVQLWINEPLVNNKIINLSGGIPGGMIGDKKLVAKIAFQARAAGEGNIDFTKDSSVFINDGQGTRLELQESGGPIFNVIPRPKDDNPEDIKQDENKRDRTKPSKFPILIGKDPRVFGGKYFFSFYTTDKDSGVDHYEIKEGNDIFKIAQSPFLLNDQSLRTVIRVRAYDDAGNYRESTYPNLPTRIWWKIVSLF